MACTTSSTGSHLPGLVTPPTLAVEETLPRRPGLAMVHFRANGSDACDSVAAILAQLVQAFPGRLPLTEIDVHDRPELAARYNVRATPTILLIRDGDVVDRVIGGVSKILLQSLLDARAPRPPDASSKLSHHSQSCGNEGVHATCTPHTAVTTTEETHLSRKEQPMRLHSKTRPMTRPLGLVLAMLVVALPAVAQAQSARAVLKDAQGKVVGAATLNEVSGGVKIVVQVSGMKPGEHGFHIHAVGKCEPPAFTSAGAHFNPYGKKHGHKNPEGAHAGDLPNLTVGADGTGSIDVTAARVTLTPARASLLQPGGTSLVIHADPDDEKTDPAGNSGARLVCGVIAPPSSAQSSR